MTCTALPHRTAPGATDEAFSRAAAVTRLLTPEEEQALGRRIAAGDEVARQHLVHANLRLVIERGVHFATYASWAIRQAMSEAVRRGASAAYLPARDARRAIRLRRTETDRARGDDARLIRAVTAAASLDAPLADGGVPLRDLLEDPDAHDPFEDVARSSADAVVRERLRHLPAREREDPALGALREAA